MDQNFSFLDADLTWSLTLLKLCYWYELECCVKIGMFVKKEVKLHSNDSL